jgi:hypothetical protein
MLLTAAMPAASAFGVLSVEAPPGGPSPEGYEAFAAPPRAVWGLGVFGWRVEWETAAGSKGEAHLSDTRLSDPIIERPRPTASPAGAPAPFVRGLIFTTSQVSAISVDGGPQLATVPVPGLAGVVSSAAYEVPGVSLREFGGRTRKEVIPAKLFVTLTPFDAGGQPITESVPPTPIPPIPPPALETRQWERPARPARGVCRIVARHLPGLVATSGSVISVLRRVSGVPGRPYVTCAITNFKYRNDSPELEAQMVLDAVHPGVAPSPIAALTPVSGQPGVFQSRLDGGSVVGRRVPGAWLLVEEGASLAQRLVLLATLRASVHLSHSTLFRAGAR